MNFRQPIKHGFSKGSLVDARGVLAKPPLNLRGVRSLASMRQDFAFFTPAVLYLSGVFSDAPLIDFVQESRNDVNFHHYRFETKIFEGLRASDGDLAWNYVLWAIRRPFWQSFQDFMCSLTFSRPQQRMVFGVGLQDFQVLDPLTLDLKRIISNEVPQVAVSAFGLNSNRFRLAFEVPEEATSLPIVRRYAPAGDMVAFAEALHEGRNPNDARVDYQKQQRREEQRRE